MAALIPPNPATPYATFAAEGGRLSALPESELIGAYKRFGAILLRGFDVDLDRFRDLTKRLCTSSVFNESPGREVLDPEQNIQTVNLGDQAFPLHPELSREPWKPDICFFWCMQAPTNGGQTTVCDGVEIVRQLPASVKDALAGRQLRYRQMATPAECLFWLGAAEPDDAALANPPAPCPYSFERANGKIHRFFVMPALHKPMFSDELAFGNFLFFARYFNRLRIFPTFENGDLVPDDLLDQIKAVADRLETPVPWRSGDVVILDNTRFMHGRRPITDISERRIATFFGYVRFAEIATREKQFPWRSASFKPPVLA
ncbi:TauD/TfdA family dioxygenase [Candidatus Viadribacter manganicus]|uniref:TauD/TfdA-like domain-containing protein n=1 Tax=Candidatus Viadribacter manganicus TaxID=1759059 RepID=A0A1B1AK63_9PROT|nr:TauD/TfdA family dioxygenase [Candidatus Viadribacter manganicus]ANP46954.1 hypothetical protein ATE48_14020 [Candidatus Viadribacter manganicus]